ncbi:hypothetical protein [Arthrobacter sp. 3Tela_A]|uniref:hypothetical protein n=1 Tax=Arthrobacter sp. 3Tela_A TaxID=3093743 RepID=UPI003BB667ED
MRTKVLTAAGILALALAGCSQAAPAPDTNEPSSSPSIPAQEKFLGSTSGTSSGAIKGTFGTHGEVVATYLTCSSDGELLIRVLDSEPVTVPCGTADSPTRTVFGDLVAGPKLSVDVQPAGDPVAYSLVLTDAKK